MVFWTFSISEILLALISLKYFSLIPVFVRPFSLKLFLSLDLSIICFSEKFGHLVMLLKRRTFALTGAISFKISGRLSGKWSNLSFSTNLV